MLQLLVRDVLQDVVEVLKRRAAEHGRSAEVEHRIILKEALRAGWAGFRARAAALPEETQGASRSHRRSLYGKIGMGVRIAVRAPPLAGCVRLLTA